MEASTTTTPQETIAVETTDPERPTPCAPITYFAEPNANENWAVVNDDVMGGRSLGDRTFTDETMTFAGSINTNGGGFSSLRLPLAPGALAEADRIVFRGRSDGRGYMVTFDDALDGRDRRISFRAPIEFDSPDEWETVTVYFDDLWPAAFGQPVAAEPFRKDLATRMGIMLSDSVDGDFTLELDAIEVCGPDM